jgi:hypothetical protein
MDGWMDGWMEGEERWAGTVVDRSLAGTVVDCSLGEEGGRLQSTTVAGWLCGSCGERGRG